jgi:small conductance mechanosensitive channel
VITGVLVLSIFIDSTGLLTFLGLFSAAFGLGARPLVSDYLSGAIFLFEDQYNVGEKVEIFGIEGTVIDVNLRTTMLRSPSGEIYIIPNKSRHLDGALAVLEQLMPTLPAKIPELTETPRILSEDGALGDQVSLTIFAKARYTEGAEARRKLLSVINDALEEAGIDTTA